MSRRGLIAGFLWALAACQSVPFAAAVPIAQTQQKGRYAPRDDCAQVPGAAGFRRKLIDAATKGDAEAVAALASPDIKLGFAGDDGRARFLAQLRDPKGELIGELRRVLELGCAVDAEGNLSAPWYFAQDMGEIDGYAAAIVTGEEVPLLAAPDAGSAVRQRLSWDLVELNAGLYPDRPFQEVEAAGGVKGFVATSKLRSLLDYRLIAEREAGEWKITAFVAGD